MFLQIAQHRLKAWITSCQPVLRHAHRRGNLPVTKTFLAHRICHHNIAAFQRNTDAHSKKAFVVNFNTETDF
jgi:hypothetical protein